jgi:hypothetical protein
LPLFLFHRDFAYYSPIGSESDRHRVIVSFAYQNGWHVSFFDGDRRCTLLPRTAFFNSEESMVEFIRRADGLKILEDRTIFGMQIKRDYGDDVDLHLSREQYRELIKGKR